MAASEELLALFVRLEASSDFQKYIEYLQEELRIQDVNNRILEGVDLHRGQGKASFIASQVDRITKSRAAMERLQAGS